MRGVATTAVTSPKMSWRYRFDQGDWKNYEDIDMGSKGDRNPYKQTGYLGMADGEMEIEVVVTDAVEMLLSKIQIHFKELGIR